MHILLRHIVVPVLALALLALHVAQAQSPAPGQTAELIRVALVQAQ
jgi:hypothetical protein